MILEFKLTENFKTAKSKTKVIVAVFIFDLKLKLKSFDWWNFSKMKWKLKVVKHKNDFETKLLKRINTNTFFCEFKLFNLMCLSFDKQLSFQWIKFRLKKKLNEL